MTTAPTPLHQECADFATSLRSASNVAMATRGAAPPSFLRAADLFESAAAELARLEAENRRLRADQAQAMSEASSLAMSLFQKHYSSDPDYASGAVKFGVCDDLRGVISQIDNMSTGLARAGLEARKPLPLSDEQIDAIADGMPGGLGGFMKTWGWRQFARKILDLRAPPTWEPGFDFMAPGQEELAIQFCVEIAGLRGQKGSPPDPVRLMEMAEALYKAEADARGITGGSS